MSEQPNRKLCPMSFRFHPTSDENDGMLRAMDCQQERCAWWDDGMCAVVSLAESVRWAAQCIDSLDVGVRQK